MFFKGGKMAPTTSGKIQRFVGTNITLHSKEGVSTKIGDGLVITDGEKIHIWTGKQTDNRSFLIPDESVKELDVEEIKKATYRDIDTGNFKTFHF